MISWNRKGWPQGPTKCRTWLEPFAVAGHAVLAKAEKPCFCCGFSSDGSPKFQVSNWSGATTVRTPVCGGEFQPYGAVELHAVVSMIASVCSDALLDRIDAGHHRLLSGNLNKMTLELNVMTPEVERRLHIGGHLQLAKQLPKRILRHLRRARAVPVSTTRVSC